MKIQEDNRKESVFNVYVHVFVCVCLFVFVYACACVYYLSAFLKVMAIFFTTILSLFWHEKKQKNSSVSYFTTIKMCSFLT